MNEPSSSAAGLKSNENRVLDALANAATPLSKGELARQVFGETTGSTQAMISRVTRDLHLRGLIEETQQGRFREVVITEHGRRAALPPLARGPFTRQQFLNLRIAAGGNATRNVESHPLRARNIKHLHSAAAISAHHLAKRSTWTESDELFAQCLLTLMDEQPDGIDAKRDLGEIRPLVARWPKVDIWKAALVEVLALIQDDEERTNNASKLAAELLRLAGDCLTTPETSLLWAAGTGSLLGPLRSSYQSGGGLRSSLVESLRDTLLRGEGVNERMSHYWRARCLIAFGSFRAARHDWPRRPFDMIHNPGDDELSRTADRVGLDVAASGEVNVAIFDHDHFANATILPRVVSRMSALPEGRECVDAIFEDRDGWSAAWNEAHRTLLEDSPAYRTSVAAVQTLPERIPADVSTFEIAQLHAFRCGATGIAIPAVPDGTLKRILRKHVVDNLWSVPMVLSYVAALHTHDLIIPNELSS